MKKILIADDSIVYRHALTSALSEESEFSVVGSVKNGQELIDYLAKNSVDLITLDIEMPIMDGFQVIEKLSQFPTKPKIIVFTSLDGQGAGNALKALQLGADDFVTKLEGSGDIAKNIADIKESLIPKIKSLLKINIVSIGSPVLTAPVNNIKSINNLNKKIKNNYKYILLGCSTGGPEALRFLFKDFNGKKMPPIFIVQHMPPVYTEYLAKALNEHTSYNVVEAKNGDMVKDGMCYIAPGDYHLIIANKPGSENLQIQLNKEEKECFVRPSVNFLFRSAKNIVENSLFVVLTGMGSDGADGIQFLIDKKPDVLIQDEESSTVWGMPGEIYNRKLYSDIKSLIEIKEILSKII